MSVAIVGAGAMGGLWAARLSTVGVPVVVVDVAPEPIDAIVAHGLTLHLPAGSLTAHPRATTRPDEVGPVDYVFIFVKAHQTEAAAGFSRPLLGESTTVVSLQNGWGSAETLALSIEPARLVVGVTYFGAGVVAPGRVTQTAEGPTFIGPYLDDGSLGPAEAVRYLLAACGVDVTATPRVKTEIWKKLILNAATLPVAALTRLPSGELGTPGPLRDLVDGLAAEAVAVALRHGHQIDLAERLAEIHAMLDAAPSARASMLQDVEAGRKTEIDVTNGAVVRAAEQAGLDAPLNRAITALIGGIERGVRR